MDLLKETHRERERERRRERRREKADRESAVRKRAVRERKRAGSDRVREREREKERKRVALSLSYRERATGAVATHMDCGLQVHANGCRKRRATSAAHSSSSRARLQKTRACDNPYRTIWRKLRIAQRSRYRLRSACRTRHNFRRSRLDDDDDDGTDEEMEEQPKENNHVAI